MLLELNDQITFLLNALLCVTGYWLFGSELVMDVHYVRGSSENMTKSVIVDLLKIFRASYTAVLPDKVVRKCVTYDKQCDTLSIAGVKYQLRDKNVYVVGAGKAVQYMAKEINIILGSKLKQGIISIPAKSMVPCTVTSNFTCCEGAQDNLPDHAAEATAKKIKDLALRLKKNDVLLVLISGGGSALLPLPKEPVTLNEKVELIKKLANSGADINDLNVVRKKISAIKGGKLAIAASPALIVTLIISDVVDDQLDIIASGPTIEDTGDNQMAINIIKKFKLYKNLPTSIKKVLEVQTVPEDFPEEDIHNYLLASNETSILAACNEALHSNYMPIVISRAVVGNVKNIAKEYVKLTKAFSEYLNKKIDVGTLKHQVSCIKIPGIQRGFIESIEKFQDPNRKQICLILGGECTVEVKGTGKGGRNQQLALEFSNCIHQCKDDFKGCNVYMLSAGTDGIDGPTDAAGAIGYLDLISDCEKSSIDVLKFLENNDSYNFYKHFDNGMMHVITGHTNTNVMDTHLIIVQCQ